MTAFPDIKLEGDKVIVEANDLVLISKDRLTNNSSNRRALVHDFNDGLTINWEEDFPGGVTIEGEMKTGKLKAAAIDLDGALTVFLTFDPRTGEITLPSDLSSRTVSAALSEAVRLRRHIDSGNIVVPYRVGGGSPGRTATNVLTHSEASAAIDNNMLSNAVTLPIDIVRTVVELREENRELRRRIEKLENTP